MNVAELVIEAVHTIQAQEKKESFEALLTCELYQHNVSVLIAQHPILGICALVNDKEMANVIRTLIKLTFEVGRLYGRSEVVNETLGGMKE